MRRPLMRTLMLALIAAALGVSSAFLVACGDRNDLIPSGDASALQSDLDQASSLYGRQECKAAQAAVRRAESRAQALPPEVDSDLRKTLDDNLQHVLTRIVVDCGKTRSTQSTQTTATTPTQTTATTPPTTETTPTTTEQPTTTSEPTTTKTVPPTTDSGGTPPGSDSGGESP
jgi:hypothetical protein